MSRTKEYIKMNLKAVASLSKRLIASALLVAAITHIAHLELGKPSSHSVWKPQY